MCVRRRRVAAWAVPHRARWWRIRSIRRLPTERSASVPTGGVSRASRVSRVNSRNAIVVHYHTPPVAQATRPAG